MSDSRSPAAPLWLLNHLPIKFIDFAKRVTNPGHSRSSAYAFVLSGPDSLSNTGGRNCKARRLLAKTPKSILDADINTRAKSVTQCCGDYDGFIHDANTCA